MTSIPSNRMKDDCTISGQTTCYDLLLAFQSKPSGSLRIQSCKRECGLIQRFRKRAAASNQDEQI